MTSFVMVEGVTLHAGRFSRPPGPTFVLAKDRDERNQ